MGKRAFDIAAATALLIALFVPLVLIALAVRMTSKGPALYWSNRVGRMNRIFRMPKFRTMHLNTPEVATHLLREHDRFITPVGAFLRRTSLDEVPQLLSILRGDMSFVGPRPALFNQDDLVAVRTQKNIHTLIPGLTGWAQVNGRDDLPIPVKAAFDEQYLQHRSFSFDMQILCRTVAAVIRKDGVDH